MPTKFPEYIALDNAGKVFPGQNSQSWSNVFRLSFKLKQEVEPEILEKAIESTLERIPYFKVRIRNGFFSNYFEKNEMDFPLREDIKNPCYRINFKENNGYLFRVFYYKRRISMDVYHALCDGYGATVFLSTLVGEYLRLKGTELSFNRFVLDTGDEISEREYEDAYEVYATSKEKCKLLEKKAYHKRGKKMPVHMCNYTEIILPFKDLYAVSKGYGVTVTELLAAVLMDIHYRIQLSQGKGKKDISVQIPVNLRKEFPTPSLRNFVICLSVKISPRKGEYTFEEIVKSVSRQLKQVNNKSFLHAYITQTVKLQSTLMRFIPLAFKNFCVRAAFTFGKEYSTTALISNLGPIVLPQEIEKQVERISFYTGPGIVNGARCGVVSFGDKLVIAVSNRYEENDVERALVERLCAMGISLAVETNRDEAYPEREGVACSGERPCGERVFIPDARDKKPYKKKSLTVKERLKRYFFT